MLDVQAQPGQRRAQLVRGVGDEAVVQGQHGTQAAEQRVDGLRQRPDLQRYVGAIDRGQFIGACGQPRGQRIEHAQAPADAEPDQRKHAGDQQCLRHDRQQQNFPRLLVPVAQGFGDGDDQAVAGVVVHGDMHRGGAQGVLPQLRVVQRRPGADRRYLRGLRQLPVAGQQAVPGTAHGEVAVAVRVVLEQEARLRGQFAIELVVAEHRRQGQRIVAEIAIVHPVGIGQRHGIGQQRVQQQQHAYRDQQNQQQAPAQARAQRTHARRVHAWPFPVSFVSSSR